jgi:hypothetical protein
MFRNRITPCVALLVLIAIALPAAASATNDPQLTSAGGTVPVGSKFELTNVGELIWWNTSTNIRLLTIPGTVTLTGEVTTNSGGTVKGKISTADFSGTGAVSTDNGLNEGTGEIGNSYVTVKNLPLELSSMPTMATDEFQVTGSAGAKVKFLLGSTTAGECEYEAVGSIKGDYTTGTSATTDAKLTTRDTEAGSGSKLIRGGFLCPGSLVWSWSLTLEKDNVAEAIWIS